MNELIELAALDPLAVPSDVEKLAELARQQSIPAVCVAPHLLAALEDTQLRVSSVCGYPHGTHHPLIKATEARFAVQNGAEEIALVPNLGAIASGDMNVLLGEIVAVREAITEHIALTVILETAAFTPEQIQVAADTAARAGADFLQTNTGCFSDEIVGLDQLRAVLPTKVVGTPERAADLLAAGASRVIISA